MSEGPRQRGTLCVAIFAGARCGTVFVRARLLVRAFCGNLEGDTVGLARGVDSRRRACSLVRWPELDARRPSDSAPVTMCYMMGVMRAAAPAVVDALSCSGTPVSYTHLQQVRSQEAPSVPVADYSGHEGMWAAALAILADESVSALTSVSSTPAVAEPAATSVMDARRMAAIAEGSHATRLHSHVNSIIEEEFDKVPSKSVHRTAHELSLIHI